GHRPALPRLPSPIGAGPTDICGVCLPARQKNRATDGVDDGNARNATWAGPAGLPGTAGKGEPQQELGRGHGTFLRQAGLLDTIDIAHDESAGEFYWIVPPHHGESLKHRRVRRGERGVADVPKAVVASSHQ